MSGISILLGGVLGFIMHLVLPIQIGKPPGKFDTRIFFNFMLPFLILSAGYNMKRRRFFRNIGSIILFGVLGTIICFVVIGLGAYLISNCDIIELNTGQIEHISVNEALMLGAVLSASDVVCALSLVKEGETPRLHSILFGEAVVNDAIGILLFQTLQTVDLSRVSGDTISVFVGMFLYICATSVLLGALFGLLAAICTKKFTALKEGASQQTAFLFYMAWASYILAELLGISGVFTMLVCCIIMGHYAWYNLTPTARIVTSDSFKFLSDGAEALIFSYLGLTLITYVNDKGSIYFVFALILVIMFARLISTFGLSYLLRVITWGRYALPHSMISVVWLGGTIRGAVAFALISGVTGKHSELMNSVVLGLVVITTIVFGSFLPL